VKTVPPCWASIRRKPIRKSKIEKDPNILIFSFFFSETIIISPVYRMFVNKHTRFGLQNKKSECRFQRKPSNALASTTTSRPCTTHSRFLYERVEHTKTIRPERCYCKKKFIAFFIPIKFSLKFSIWGACSQTLNEPEKLILKILAFVKRRMKIASILICVSTF